MTDLDDIGFLIAKGSNEWDVLYDRELRSYANSRKDVISVTHTPRNIGQTNIIIVWYTTSRSSTSYAVKHL